jgi:hypothetical protein
MLQTFVKMYNVNRFFGLYSDLANMLFEMKLFILITNFSALSKSVQY